MTPTVPRVQARLAGGVGLLVLVLLLALIVADAGERGDRAEAEVRRLVQHVARLRELALSAGPAPIQVSVPAASALLPGPTRAQAAAGLQALIRDKAKSSGVHLTSSQVLPFRAIDGAAVAQVTVRLRARSGIGELQALMHALESAIPPLILDGLHVRAPGGAPGGAAGGRMDVRLDVIGHVANGEAP